MTLYMTSLHDLNPLRIRDNLIYPNSTNAVPGILLSKIQRELGNQVAGSTLNSETIRAIISHYFQILQKKNQDLNYIK